MKSHIKSTCVLWLIAMVFTACHNDLEIQEVEKEETFSFSTQSCITRTALHTDGTTVVWNQADEIAVYDGTASKHSFTATLLHDGLVRFSGNISKGHEQFWAAYPFSQTAEDLTKNHELCVTIPSSQQGVEGTFAPNLNISVAKGRRNQNGAPCEVTFKNVCQLIQFTIPSYAHHQISSIQFLTSKPIVGNLYIGMEEEVPTVHGEETGAQAITLSPPSSESTFPSGTYYLVTAPVVLNGFEMQFTCQNSSHYIRSAQTLGGEAGKIYNLGTIDVVNQPRVSPQHLYQDQILQGTSLRIAPAPISEGNWQVNIHNASNQLVRQVQGTGDLESQPDNTDWPYLPQGLYTATYTYTTSKGRDITQSFAFEITEQPKFSVQLSAYTSYSYYKGDGVTKDVSKANTLQNQTIYEPTLTVQGISPSILNNTHYSIQTSHDFGSSLKSKDAGIYQYENLIQMSYNAHTLHASATFDGITQEASKTVYITGLPYQCEPPTENDWTGSANSWESTYVRLHNQSIQKSFYAPEDLNVSVRQRVAVRRATISTTYSLQCSGTNLKSITPGYNTTTNDANEYPGVMKKDNPTISCINTYGNPGSQGTRAQIYQIAITYQE